MVLEELDVVETSVKKIKYNEPSWKRDSGKT